MYIVLKPPPNITLAVTSQDIDRERLKLSCGTMGVYHSHHRGGGVSMIHYDTLPWAIFGVP